MFEKEAIRHAFEDTIGVECLIKPVEDFTYEELSDEQQEKAYDFKKGAEFGYNKGFEFGVKSNEKVNQIVANEWHYPSKSEYPEKGKEILLYTKTLGLIFGEFCKGYNNIWTSHRCDFTTEGIIAWIEKEKILPKESE